MGNDIVKREDANLSQFIVYENEHGVAKVDVRFCNNDVWLTQQQIAELFDCSRTNIVEHISNIYRDEELFENSTCRNFRQVQFEGKRQQYLIFAQTQARARIPMTMKNWIDKLHGFLTLNDREILKDAGKISAKLAKEHAEKEYEIFRAKQAQIPYNTDFEEFVGMTVNIPHKKTIKRGCK